MTVACSQVAPGSTPQPPPPPLKSNSETKDSHWAPVANATDCRALFGMTAVPPSLMSYNPIINHEDDHGSACRSRDAASLKCRRLADKSSHGLLHQGSASACQALGIPAFSVSSSTPNAGLGGFWNSRRTSTTLCVVSEDKPWDNFTALECLRQDNDLPSTSSSIGANSSCASIEDASGDSEVQSKYQGPLDTLCSLEDALPNKKALSKFYTGKSRSYSCLADVACIPDIAKPENPYAKKRKHYVSLENDYKRRLHPIQNGSPKGLHSSKCSSATGTRKLKLRLEKDQYFSSPPSRSYSLSDLQHGGQHYL